MRGVNFSLIVTNEKFAPIMHATCIADSQSPSTGIFAISRASRSPGSAMLPIRNASNPSRTARCTFFSTSPVSRYSR